MLKRLFGAQGGPGTAEARPVDKKNAEAKTLGALEQLREKEKINEEKIEHLHKQIDAQQNLVKKLLADQQKEKAKVALKRKKMLEKQVEAVQNNNDRIMEQIIQLDMAQNNILTVQALASAAEAGKANLKANNLENVDQVLEDIGEQNDQMQQIQDALAISTVTGVDDADLDAELDELKEMEIDQELADAPVPTQPATALPAVPTATPLPEAPRTSAQKSQADEELEALAKELGMEAA